MFSIFQRQVWRSSHCTVKQNTSKTNFTLYIIIYLNKMTSFKNHNLSRCYTYLFISYFNNRFVIYIKINKNILLSLLINYAAKIWFRHICIYDYNFMNRITIQAQNCNAKYQLHKKKVTFTIANFTRCLFPRFPFCNQSHSWCVSRFIFYYIKAIMIL